MTGLQDAFESLFVALAPGGWHALTWLGDSALMLPAAVLIALWLALTPGRRGAALGWCVVFGLGGGLVLLSKLAFMGWGLGSERFDFTGISGHTAIGTSVWSVALWLSFAARSSRAGGLALAAGWALGAAIGMSRLALDAHSVSEVLAGFVLGVTVTLGFLRLAGRPVLSRLPWPALLVALLLPIVFLTPGKPAPTQALIETMAVRLAGIERPFTRHDLRAM